MIKAEFLLQGGHTVTVETKHDSVDQALGKFKQELTGGWQSFQAKYLIHPGSISAIRVYDTAENDGQAGARFDYAEKS